MTRWTAVAAAALCGCSSATIDGTLKDGLTGNPIPDLRIVAKATAPDASLTCQAFEATTGADGAFRIEGACTGTGYALSLGDDAWWVPDLQEIPDGGASGLDLVAWRNAPGRGLYKIDKDGGFHSLRTHADVKSEKILGSEEKVRFPWPSIPGNIPVIAKGEWLVMVGPAVVDHYEIIPLVQSGERKFGDAETWVTMQPWYYIGTRFTDDRTFERVAATIDGSKVVEKRAGERAGKYVPGEAVAEGRYAVLAPDSRTVTLVDFGRAWTGVEEAEGG